MPNEVLLIVGAVLDLLFLLTVARFDRAWLYVYIAVNLLLITVIGTKLIPVFGAITNVGNVFYAATFLAIYLLIELRGTKDAYEAVWAGGIAIFFFSMMLQLAVSTSSIPEFYAINKAITLATRQSMRLALASGFGFIISQHVNIWLYDLLRRKVMRRSFFMAANLSNILVQVLDSVLFFSIAFLGSVSLGEVWQSMFAGYLIKVGFVLVTSPFLLLQFPTKKKK